MLRIRLTTVAAATTSALMIAGVGYALVAPTAAPTDGASDAPSDDDPSDTASDPADDTGPLAGRTPDEATDGPDDDPTDAPDDDPTDAVVAPAAADGTDASDRPTDRPSDDARPRHGTFDVVAGDRLVGVVDLQFDGEVLSVADVRTEWRYEVEQEHRHEVRVWFHRDGVTVVFKAELSGEGLETATRVVDDGRDEDRSGPDDGTDDRSGPDDGTDDRSGPDDGTDDHSGPDDGTDDHSGPDDGTDDHSGPDDGTDDHSGPDDGGQSSDDATDGATGSDA